MQPYDYYLDFLKVSETEETCKALRDFFLRLVEVLRTNEMTYCFAGQLAFSHHSERQNTACIDVFVDSTHRGELLQRLPELTAVSDDALTYVIKSDAAPYTGYRFSLILLSDKDMRGLEYELSFTAFKVHNLNVVSRNCLGKMTDILAKSGVSSKLDMSYFKARLLHLEEMSQAVDHSAVNAAGWAWLQKKKLNEGLGKD